MIPVIALDLATATGWALLDRQGQLTSGVQHFPLGRGDSAGMRFLRFRGWLREILALGQMGKEFSAVEPGIICYEQAHHRGGHATQLALGLVTSVLTEAAERQLETSAIATSTLKKFATGSGRAEKSAMISRAQEVFPDIAIIDDNHADALLLLSCGLAQIGAKLPQS